MISGPPDGLQVGDHGERLERGRREGTVRRALQEPCTRLGGRRRGAEPVATRDPLEHDAAAPLRVPLGERVERALDALGRRLGGRRELGDRQRLAAHEQQRLDHVRQLAAHATACSGSAATGGPREQADRARDPDRAERLGLAGTQLAALVQLEQCEERGRLLLA